MNINVVCVGTLKEKFYEDAVNEYAKRLSRFCKFKVVEVKEEQLPKNASNKDVENVKLKESLRIKEKLPSGYNVLLFVTGNMLTSEQLSEKIEKISESASTINFIIGGSYGVNEKALEKIDYKLSFSKLTFPHQLMRVILCEQIYRAFTISNGITYHK